MQFPISARLFNFPFVYFFFYYLLQQHKRCANIILARCRSSFWCELLCCCHMSAVVNLISTECGGGDTLHPAERVFGYHEPLWPVSLCAWPRLNGHRQGAVSWAWWVCQMKVLIEVKDGSWPNEGQHPKLIATMFGTFLLCVLGTQRAFFLCACNLYQRLQPRDISYMTTRRNKIFLTFSPSNMRHITVN